MGGLDGSDDLLELEMELIMDGPELAVGQGGVDVFRKERHGRGLMLFRLSSRWSETSVICSSRF